MDKTQNHFYVTIHSMCPGRPENTGNDFICDLPSELYLSPFDNYQIALIRFICDKPIIVGPPGSGGKEIVIVEMSNIRTISGGRPLIALQHVRPEFVSLRDRWREFHQCSSLMLLEPTHKHFFPFDSTQFTNIGLKLYDRHLRPFYTKRQLVAASTAVFEVRKMTDFAQQERVPLFLSSHATEEYPDNTVSSFKVDIPPRFQSRTGKPWHIALTSFTYTPQFSLFPTVLNGIQKIILRRNLDADFNSLQNLMETGSIGSGGDEPDEDDNQPMWYKVDAETGDVIWSVRMARLIEPAGKRELMHALKKEMHLDDGEDDFFKIDIDKNQHSGADMSRAMNNRGAVQFFFGTKYEGAELELNYFLAVILGLTSYDPSKRINDSVKIPCNRPIRRQNKFDNWFEPKKMFVYANFVEPSINGPVYTRLLDVIPVERGGGDDEPEDGFIHYQTYSPKQLTYKRFDPTQLTECEISIRDDFGNLVHFKYPTQAHTFMSLIIAADK